MKFFKIERTGDTLNIDFGETAGTNVEIVTEVGETLQQIDLTGGGTLKINGRASLPVGMQIAHAVGHLFTEIACFDPKLDAYVVVISHGGSPVGSLIA